MENTTRSSNSTLSLERLLLLFIMIFGCYGLSVALGSLTKDDNYGSSINYQDQLKQEQILELQGSFQVNAPIQFEVQFQENGMRNSQIDFGNGITKQLQNASFTYAYQREGYYEISIKNNGETIFLKTIQIRGSIASNKDLLVMK